MAPAVCIHRRPDSRLKAAGMSITVKGISNSHGPTNIFKLISPHAEVLVPLKALISMMFGRMRQSSIPMRLEVTIGQTFKVDPLSINTREMIIPLHIAAKTSLRIVLSEGEKPICVLTKLLSQLINCEIHGMSQTGAIFFLMR